MIITEHETELAHIKFYIKTIEGKLEKYSNISLTQLRTRVTTHPLTCALTTHSPLTHSPYSPASPVDTDENDDENDDEDNNANHNPNPKP